VQSVTIKAAAAALGAVLLALAPASAQVGRPEHVRAVAAGYKASFICSNWFNAGMDEAGTAADDLRGTYPELNPLFSQLPAELDRINRRVAVRYSEDMPPRIAVWRLYLGCALLPIGARPEDARAVPALSQDPPEFGAFDRRPWPMGDVRATALPQGDARALARSFASAFDRRTYGQGSETTAVLVVQDGRIVAERYRPDFDMHRSQRTWSVAKSIAGTVLGAAVQQGLIRTDQPAPVPEWQSPGDPRRAITFDQLMRMASGLHSDFPGNRTDDLYFGGVAVRDQIAGWPLVAPPGTRFRYANNDTLAAIRALQHVLGDGDESRLFPFHALFWRIGMTRTVPETDWRGHFIMSSQVWTTARDLARLGLLYLNDGVWQGERILPRGWRDHVGRRGPAQPAAGEGYGATWWTFAADSGLPADAIVAQGNRGQYVAVIPSRRLVIVRRGFDAGGMAFDFDAFTRDVLAALR
jgi:CubicO group peptidase (beta-lactamase class C family)